MGEGTELLVNCSNHQRAERGLSEEIQDIREAIAAMGEVAALIEEERVAALQRLRRVAASNDMLADLLIVLGLSESVPLCQESSGQSTGTRERLLLRWQRLPLTGIIRR